jgi:hypothetical protein
MKTNQRGISDIITTVLIILLAIAAVVMIWGFIKKPIEQGGQQIVATTDCMSLKLTPIICSITYNTTSYNKMIHSGVKWAEGNVALKGMKFVFTDAGGATLVKDVTASSSLTLLGTQTADFNDTSSTLSTSVSLSVVGVVQPANGKETTCTSAQTETFACTYNKVS